MSAVKDKLGDSYAAVESVANSKGRVQIGATAPPGHVAKIAIEAN